MARSTKTLAGTQSRNEKIAKQKEIRKTRKGRNRYLIKRSCREKDKITMFILLARNNRRLTAIVNQIVTK